jgi:hypothetical protein
VGVRDDPQPRCIAPELPEAHRTDCDAKGDTDKGAEAHTKATGHPTMTSIRRQP